jgi:hypothetical protein
MEPRHPASQEEDFDRIAEAPPGDTEHIDDDWEDDDDDTIDGEPASI